MQVKLYDQSYLAHLLMLKILINRYFKKKLDEFEQI